MSEALAPAIPVSLPAPRVGINPWFIAITVTLATFMELLDTAIANVSLRYIAGSLAASVDESTWVVSTYLIANAVIFFASDLAGFVNGQILQVDGGR